MTDWIIRDAMDSDIAFIYRSWIDSYHANSSIGDCPKSLFNREYKEVIDYILTFPTNGTKVACKPDEPDVIFGYVVYEKAKLVGPYLVHYVYVKENFRKFGIARDLITSLAMDPRFIVTHRTDVAKKILTKYPQILYNPFILFHKGSCDI